MKATYRLVLERSGKHPIEAKGYVRGSVLATLFGRAFRLARDALAGRRIYFHRWDSITLSIGRYYD